MNPLNTIKGTLIAGLIIAIVLTFAVNMSFHPEFSVLAVLRWLHIVAGITWIGLLYYFNFVSTPAMAAAAADKGGPGGAGISKYVTPLALLWFRWAAAVTWLAGFAYLAATGTLGAFALGLNSTPVYHAIQRLGTDLAKPEENPGNRCRQRRAKSQSTQGGFYRLPHQYHVVYSHDHVHGFGKPWVAFLTSHDVNSSAKPGYCRAFFTRASLPL
jgi:hypothetical protein